MFRLLRRLFHRCGVVLLAAVLLNLVCYQASAAHVEFVPVTVQNNDGSLSTALQQQVVPDVFDFRAACGSAAFFDAGPRFIGNRLFVNGRVFVPRVFHPFVPVHRHR